jgi:hypothetical protein
VLLVKDPRGILRDTGACSKAALAGFALSSLDDASYTTRRKMASGR